MAKSTRDKWSFLKQIVTGIIDRYFIVDQMQQVQEKTKPPRAACNILNTNPHVSRIEAENCYITPHHVRIQAEHDYLPSQPPKRKRKLPPWFNPETTVRSPTLEVRYGV